MKIAAIDLGSNSIHMVIAEANRSGGFQVLDGEKDMVRLGAGTLSRGRLSATVMHRAVEVLKDYQRLAERHKVDKVVAVATSAIREASNGEDLLERIGREVGIYVRPISGEDEARFIYKAACNSIHLEDRQVLVLDMGGGSLEVALGKGPDVLYAASEKLGVLRMTERFVTADPLPAEDELAIQAHVLETMAPHVEKIVSAGFDCAVGTSGTILALGALAHAQETGRRPDVLHHLTVGAAAIHEVCRRLVHAPLKERLKIHGLDPMRADIIPAGAVALDALFGLLGVKEIILSDWALREGVLMDYIRAHPRKVASAEEYPDIRRRSVMELAERCLIDQAHAFHVAVLATRLFDETRPLHGLDDADRDMLEYGALLHDIGHHISHPKHHRHSYYLIRNGDLKGFSPVEIDLMACLGRYHRRGTPRKKDPEMALLPAPARRKIRVLSGILRVADALDRGHRQAVRDVTVHREGLCLRIGCAGSADMELELWGARRRVDLLGKALGV
ncbi:MAG TPA: Ppx/GppA phosphatase family protein, partial [Candidatus Saccharimonadales bacterium]|nr:Ppx/GppA phosphatase family protein [Candidatus Saccharimonadales bacterium]